VPKPAATGLAVGVLNRFELALERAVAQVRLRSHDAWHRVE
jgi:hypothetical protein